MNAYIRQESLYHTESDSLEKTALKRSKKLVIGKHAIIALIKGFIDLEKSEQCRRWVRSCKTASESKLTVMAGGSPCAGAT